MRYILDDNGYVESVSCNHIECDFKGCTEYKGLIPLGYYSLEEWATKGNIRAYKIVDGTFTYDSDRAAAIESEMRKGFYPSKYSQDEIIIGEWFGKPLYRKVVQYTLTATSGWPYFETGIRDIEYAMIDLYKSDSGDTNTNYFRNAPAISGYLDKNNGRYTFILTDAGVFKADKGLYTFIFKYTKTTDEAREEENFFEEPDLSIDANIP